MANVLYQYAYQEVGLPILNPDGTAYNATAAVEAEYRITQAGTCTAVYSASLGSGITLNGTDLLLTIPENTLTVAGTNNEYRHYLRIAEAAGELEAPVFDQFVTIIPGCEIT